MLHRTEENVGTYPRGWFQVGYTSDLLPGAVEKIRYFGQELVLFRTESGSAHVFDAYCAHLGAHLAVGGMVEGDCLRCPFHGWQYDESGHCVSIPNSDRIPKAATVNAWPTEERSGLIMVWYDPDRNAPAWSPLEMPEFGMSGWTEYPRYRRALNCPLDEVMENNFDFSHGRFLHQNPSPLKAKLEFDGHRAEITFQVDFELVGGRLEQALVLNELGMMTSRAVGAGSNVAVYAYTPVDEENLDVRFTTFMPESTPNDPTGEMCRQSAAVTEVIFEQDCPIWENKRYRAKPLLCAQDGPIGKYRRWIRQFYDPTEEPYRRSSEIFGDYEETVDEMVDEIVKV